MCSQNPSTNPSTHVRVARTSLCAYECVDVCTCKYKSSYIDSYTGQGIDHYVSVHERLFGDIPLS